MILSSIGWLCTVLLYCEVSIDSPPPHCAFCEKKSSRYSAHVLYCNDMRQTAITFLTICVTLRYLAGRCRTARYMWSRQVIVETNKHIKIRATYSTKDKKKPSPSVRENVDVVQASAWSRGTECRLRGKRWLATAATVLICYHSCRMTASLLAAFHSVQKVLPLLVASLSTRA